ncbi:hypothetical protein [Candidatus Mycoplasma haematominutum]|uniref:Uncharacterized protein n=1 Tax=Candidatus Mycoplasma haematominutum 'Birmingham 1' TaxID=1116213 RepID=G8C3F4_9MOLU|nr:hypothetical protein [Candidatus Mycoplasma haematominutum]CCE66852.1 hypothetical protein MHM_03340 [Candidatus Mycoplasma haematominutum 'Birmingham 1']
MQNFKLTNPQASQVVRGGATTEGQKAQETLTSVKSKFEELNKSITETRSKITEHQLGTVLQDWQLYAQKLKTTAIITWLEQYMQLVNSTIQKTNNRASQTTSELNTNSEKLKKSHENYNKFKTLQANFHSFGEKFQLEIQNIEKFLGS